MNHLSSRPFLRGFALVLASLLPSAAFAADTFKIDAVHSEVGFHIRHIVSKTAGHFATFSGMIQLDSGDITKSSVDVTIDPASVKTDNDARDKHLCSVDFFDASKFPAITFKSTAVTKKPDGSLELVGLFTLHGISKTITIPFTNNGTSVGMKPGSLVAGFEGTVKILRSDYGIKSYLGPVGDEVTITLNVAADKI